MTLVDALDVLRRHKLLAVYGLILALLLATFSAYRVEGNRLVSRSDPVYESTAVVAVRPGAEHPTTTAAPPTTAPPAPAGGAALGTTVPTTAPLAPLAAVIDSRAMYYTTLSLRTVVVSPGFHEAVKARAPTMDGSVRAVVAQDTNTMTVVVNGSTPAIAAETMSATLAELSAVVSNYSSTPATRFALDGVVISAPSPPSQTRSIKSPLTFVIVVAVVLLLMWFVIRAVDAIGRRRRAAAGSPGARPAGGEAKSADLADARSAALAPPHPSTGARGSRSSPNGQRDKPGARVR